ncbi:hypothetical protein BS47DRAFT_497548 [Hydnum rufescens UP504]|uniref:Secreted protein n=1 Tax=Hydnum rufescens UP504 TaxID=1448309 RepID=A0A9P6DWG1_9AGAM|nr:hypothetical protein BS47DRAFT_497548 [Hydnum rufescens UP504]
MSSCCAAPSESTALIAFTAFWLLKCGCLLESSSLGTRSAYHGLFSVRLSCTRGGLLTQIPVKNMRSEVLEPKSWHPLSVTAQPSRTFVQSSRILAPVGT